MPEISVVLALPQRQQRLRLQVEAGTTARAALQQALAAGLDLADTGLAADSVPFAIYGVQVNDGHVLVDGDRLELLRPLQQAPMALRRQRARQHDKRN